MGSWLAPTSLKAFESSTISCVAPDIPLDTRLFHLPRRLNRRGGSVWESDEKMLLESGSADQFPTRDKLFVCFRTLPRGGGNGRREGDLMRCSMVPACYRQTICTERGYGERPFLMARVKRLGVFSFFPPSLHENIRIRDGSC